MATTLDRDTVEAVYRRYGAQVERCCRKILRDPDEAADAAQEVFVKLFTRGGDFRADADWMTWLYRVSTNLCLNRLRDMHNRRKILDRHGDFVRPNVPFDPETLGKRDLLWNVLGRFDRRTQKIVVYYYLYEMSQQEVADLVGISRVSVNRRIKKFEKRAQTQMQATRVT